MIKENVINSLKMATSEVRPKQVSCSVGGGGGGGVECVKARSGGLIFFNNQNTWQEG